MAWFACWRSEEVTDGNGVGGKDWLPMVSMSEDEEDREMMDVESSSPFCIRLNFSSSTSICFCS